MTEHTKTPWQALAISNGDYMIVGDKTQHDVTLIDHRSQNAGGNARFIVTAVNSHDKLVKALQGCETLLTMIESDHPYSVPLILNQARQALKGVETQHGCSPVSMPKGYGKIRDGRIIGDSTLTTE